MKKHLLTLFGVMLAALSVSAQKPDSAQAMVHYKFSWVRDTTRRDTPYAENMVLMIGQNASVYKSYDKKMQMAAMRKQIADQMAAGAGIGPMKINVSSHGPMNTSEVYQFPNENKLVRKESMMTSYLIEEPMPQIKWKISSDTSTIRNLHCQKATTHFKGRNYTAWFCPDLPYRSGPWKLNGLPGLIVEAHDAKNEVVFKFDGIEQITKTDGAAKAAASAAQAPGGMKMVVFGGDDPNADPNLIALPDNGVKTTEKEFANLVDAMRKDPNAFSQSISAGSGMAVRPPSGGGDHVITRVVAGSPQVINNPMELPEKK